MRGLAGALVLAAGLSLSPMSSAEVFTINPGSSMHLSGKITITVGSVAASGDFVEQGPGSLNGALTGTVVANAVGNTLNFPGGGHIDVTNTGPWQPNNLPGAFGFTAHVEFSPDAFFDFVGNFRDLRFDLLGSTPLSGPAGNQTFDTSGLEFATLKGFLSGKITACAQGQCQTQTMPDEDASGPPNDPLDSQSGGTLVSLGNNRTLSIPFKASHSESQTQTVDNVSVTVALDALLQGPITGIVAVPEPSTWAIALLGTLMLGLGGLARKAKRCQLLSLSNTRDAK